MIRHTTLRAPSGARVLVAGGILGLASERPVVEVALRRERFDRILLGVPFEDLDAIKQTSGKERSSEFSRDDTDELYLQTLGRFGPVEVPPPDLYACHEHAQTEGIPVDAIDLGDEGHSNVWSENVGMFELLRNNRRLKRLELESFDAKTPEEFAREWDGTLFPTKGLRKVQDEREAWMAKRIAELTKTGSRHFALVPLARWEGVRAKLVAAGFKQE